MFNPGPMREFGKARQRQLWELAKPHEANLAPEEVETLLKESGAPLAKASRSFPHARRKGSVTGWRRFKLGLAKFLIQVGMRLGSEEIRPAHTRS